MRRLTYDQPGAGRLAFAPDGRHLYGCFGERLIGWDVAAGSRPVWTGPSDNRGQVRRLLCSPCGRWLVEVGLGGAVFVRDLATPDRAGRRIAPRILHGGSGEAAFTPDGAELVCLSADRTVRRWRVGSWRAVGAIDHRDDRERAYVTRFALTPDSAHYYAEAHGVTEGATWAELRVVARRTGECLGRVPFVGADSDGLAVTADGTGLLRNTYEALTRYDIGSHAPTAEYRRAGSWGVHDVAVCPSGSRVVLGVADRVVVLNATTLEVSAEYDFGLGLFTRVAVAPDGLTAAACGMTGGVALFDLD